MSCTWEKPRGYTDYLTADDIATLRRAFNAGKSSAEASDTVNCSVRIAQKYYTQFRGAPLPRGRPRSQPAPPPPARPSRFYKSNFEL